MASSEKVRKIIDVSLKIFMEKGLTETTTKDINDALGLNSGGTFYYFKTKDDLIIACAEEAALRIERDLIGAALKDIENPQQMIIALKERADDMRPLMLFFISVCTAQKYQGALVSTYERLNRRYDQYVKTFSEVLCCKEEEIAPYVYAAVNTLLSYMIFGITNFAAPQVNFIYKALTDLIAKRDGKK